MTSHPRLAPPLMAAALSLAAASGLAAGPPPEPAPPDTTQAAEAAEAGEAPTRAERWRALRLRKRERLAPRKAGLLERNLLAMEKAERPSLLDWNVARVYPRVANIARGSLLAGGVRLWRPDAGGTPVDVHASAFYSLRRYEFYDLQVGLLPHRGRGFPTRSTRGDDLYELGDVRATFTSRVTGYASLRYEHEPQTPFYGLGAGAPASAETSFLLQQATYEGVAGYQAGRHLSFTVRGGVRQVFVGPGRDKSVPATQAVFDDATAPGLARQPDFFHWSASVLLDGRDEPGNPHRGAVLALGWDGFDDLRSSSYRFRRLGADGRAYIPLASPQRVLALRARVSADRPAEGNVVPFYLQETLGGGHDLRGFDRFRFRGGKLVFGQAEYRWEAWPALELALFADAGRVFAEGEGLTLRSLEHDWGVGLRVKAHDATLVRLDAAWGGDGVRVGVRLGTSF